MFLHRVTLGAAPTCRASLPLRFYSTSLRHHPAMLMLGGKTAGMCQTALHPKPFRQEGDQCCIQGVEQIRPRTRKSFAQPPLLPHGCCWLCVGSHCSQVRTLPSVLVLP